MKLVHVGCPYCHTSNALPKDSVGKTARCCKCNKPFPVKTARVSTLLVAQPTDISEPIMQTPSPVDDFIVTPAPEKMPASFDQLQEAFHHRKRPDSRRRNLARMRLKTRQRRRRRNIILCVILALVILVAVLVFNQFIIPSAQNGSDTGDAGARRSTRSR